APRLAGRAEGDGGAADRPTLRAGDAAAHRLTAAQPHVEVVLARLPLERADAAIEVLVLRRQRARAGLDAFEAVMAVAVGLRRTAAHHPPRHERRDAALLDQLHAGTDSGAAVGRRDAPLDRRTRVQHQLQPLE